MAARLILLALVSIASLVNAQSSTATSSTCAPAVPLQTAWKYELPPRNPRKDFGPPQVPQGKSWQGQPKQVEKYKGKKIRNYPPINTSSYRPGIIVIITIPDGFGPASETLARNFLQWKNSEVGWNEVLAPDTIQVGSVRTRSTDAFVTDSAAAATAYSCAIKTYNGGIAVDEDGNPCGTVLEAAHFAGYKTGLVATSRITHATPASFASHIYDRDQEWIIAEQLVGNTPLGPVVDFQLGGGLGFFVPNTTTGSTRPDDVDALAYAREQGYNVILDRAGFDALQSGDGVNATKPYIGLFTKSHMSYEIDRDPAKEPSLVEMAKTVIGSLKKATKHKGKGKGYFVMVEASRIDHAAHSNDLIGHLHDILQYHELVAYLKSVVDDDTDGETVLVGTADHECGGLTLGGIVTTGEYQWSPSALNDAAHSAAYLNSLWTAYKGDNPDTYLQDIFTQYGIHDANATEISVAKELKKSSIEIHLGQSLTRRAMVKWSTLGHSAVDVNLIAYGSNTHWLHGNHDNTEIGQFIAEQLELDLPAIADKLNDLANEEWLVKSVGRDKVQGGVRPDVKLKKRSHGGCGCMEEH